MSFIETDKRHPIMWRRKNDTSVSFLTVMSDFLTRWIF